MPAHIRKYPRFCMLLFAFCFIGCQQKPWTESRQITAAQRQERDTILTPITLGVVPGKRDQWDVSHAPEMEGKPVANYQRLLDLADYVRHDPLNKKETHFYYVFFGTPSTTNPDEAGYQIFIIVVRENRIESTELPPTMDL